MVVALKLDNGEIGKLLRDGWRFSVKDVGKYRYIRRRKTGEKDVQIGPYDEELWNRINRLQDNPPSLHSRTVRLRAKARNQLAETRAHIKRETCTYNQKGYCTYWKYKPSEDFIKTFRELNEATKLQHFQTRNTANGMILVKALPDICRDCSTHKKRI